MAAAGQSVESVWIHIMWQKETRLVFLVLVLYIPSAVGLRTPCNTLYKEREFPDQFSPSLDLALLGDLHTEVSQGTTDLYCTNLEILS
jgi:hypothetical protein